VSVVLVDPVLDELPPAVISQLAGPMTVAALSSPTVIGKMP
jgi:hypothetical protein